MRDGKRQQRWLPRERSRRHSHDNPTLYAIKWLGPMCFAMFGFYLQSVGLHYATYSYVHSVMQLSRDERWHNFTTLSDGDAALGPAENVNLHALDAFAGLFPMLFIAFSAIRPQRTLQVWIRVMVCAGFLFALKGLMGAVTTVPDSNGWAVCKGRLKENGVTWMKADHRLVDMFFVDFEWVFQYHTPLRYCSDMMYSGHTFVVTLFALGCYEVLRIELAPGHEDKYDVVKKAIALSLLSFCAILEQVLEIYFVLRSRFHYTSDVIVALLVTFLLYSNGTIAIFSKQWEFKGIFLFIDPLLNLLSNLNQLKSLTGPVERELDDRGDVVGKTMTEEDFRTKHVWNARGDLFTPPCCVPCCCLAGRAHVYSDNQIYRIVLSSYLDDDTDNDVNLKELVSELNLFEGVSLRDMKFLLGIGGKQGEMAALDRLLMGKPISPDQARMSLANSDQSRFLTEAKKSPESPEPGTSPQAGNAAEASGSLMLPKPGTSPRAKEVAEDIETGTLQGFLTDSKQGKWTPLHTTALTGSMRCITPTNMEFLHATDDDMRTPLHIACFYGQVDVTKELLKARASVDARTHNGRSPLHVAAKSNNVQVSDQLLRANANPDDKDHEGLTPKDLTMNQEVLNLLKRHSAKAKQQDRWQQRGRSNSPAGIVSSRSGHASSSRF